MDGNRVIYVVGAQPDAFVMAFDKHTGEERWRALEPRSELGYSQPSIIEAGGVRQLIVWHPAGLSSLDPETGALYWEELFPGGQAPIADAVHSGSYLLVSGFYTGSLMMQLASEQTGRDGSLEGQRHRPHPGRRSRGRRVGRAPLEHHDAADPGRHDLRHLQSR